MPQNRKRVWKQRLKGGARPDVVFPRRGVAWRGVATALLLTVFLVINRAGAAEMSDGAAVRQALGIPSLPAIAPIRKAGRAPEGLGLTADEDIGVVLAKIAEAEAFAAERQWVNAAGKFQELLDRHGEVTVPVEEQTFWPVWRY